jgi:hypothetical protein
MLTRHPYIKLHRYLIQRISELYFEKEDKKIFFESMIQINKWPYPQIDYQFALPFMGHRVSYRTPLYTPHWSVNRFLNMAHDTDIHIVRGVNYILTKCRNQLLKSKQIRKLERLHLLLQSHHSKKDC